MWQAKQRTAIDRLSIIWKSNQFDKIKHIFFPSNSCVDSTLWMHHMDTDWAYREKARWQLHKNDTMNKSWKQHLTKQQLYSHLPPTEKNIQIRWMRHVGHCWRNKNELISNILLWVPSHGCASVGWPTRIYRQQLSIYTQCSLDDPPEAMDDRVE